MLARAATSGGGTRDSPPDRRPSRIKMLTPEEDKELRVRAFPSAVRGVLGVLTVDARTIVVRGPHGGILGGRSAAQTRPPRALSGFASARFHPRVRRHATFIHGVANAYGAHHHIFVSSSLS